MSRCTFGGSYGVGPRLAGRCQNGGLAGRANCHATLLGCLRQRERMRPLQVVEKLAGGLGLKMSELMSELEKVDGGIAGPATVD